MPIRASRRWILPAVPPAELYEQSPVHPLLVQTLFRRGLTTPEAIAAFLEDGSAHASDPFSLPGMEAAIARISHALDSNEIICVYGDFDADGVTSTALLVTVLQAVGASVGAYIPDRVDEGYGLNIEAIDRVGDKARLIITVDCGMRAIDEVAHANSMGIDVIVTDHHSVGAILPPALAVINPRLAEGSYLHANLAGVGVAYRLAQAILLEAAERGRNGLTEARAAEIEEELLDLVAMGTVADMMPLTGGNRQLVRAGLRRMRQSPRPGIAALLKVSGTSIAALDAQAISFRLAPRINAAGRMAHAMLAYRLLRTSDADDAMHLAQELELLNRSRQSSTLEAQTEADLQVAVQRAESLGEGAISGAPWIYMVQSDKIKSGIVGLVAGRMVESYYRPSIVVELGEVTSRGSARSIREFDIGAALDEVSDMLVRHGGHGQAAGFTVRSEVLPDLRCALTEIAQRELSGQQHLQPTLEIDAEIPVSDVNWGLLDQFRRLEPTGQANPQPLLLSRNLRVRSVRQVGDGRHLKLVLDDGWGSSVQDAIAFGMGAAATSLAPDARVDLVYALERNDFGNQRTLQLNVRDLCSATE